MNYVLHVWESPLPATLSGAARAALDMGADIVGHNPGFIILARRLAARYPATGAPDCVWTTLPLDGLTERRAWRIGVGSNHERVVGSVIRQANGLGLSVLDMQRGMAWLPGGTVLRMTEGTAPPAMVNDHLIRAQVHGGLKRLLHAVFASHGYRPRGSADGEGCRLTLPDGFIDIGVAIWDHHARYSFSLFCSVRHGRCADIVEAFDDVTPEHRGQGTCAQLHLGDIHPDGIDRIEVDGARRLHVELDSLGQVLRAHLVPLLEGWRTLEGLERHVNRPARRRDPRQPHVHYMDDIVLAWLVGNPRWEAIGAACLAALPERAGNTRQRIARLIDHLRTTHVAQPSAQPSIQSSALPGNRLDAGAARSEATAPG